MKNNFVFFSIFILFAYSGRAQQFVNGDLEGPASGISALPPNWQSVPFDDVNCQATHFGAATPDLMDTIDLGANSAGLCGRPYSGLTFVGGICGGDQANTFFQEGIMQNISGLEVGKNYNINFHQSVVKQNNALDKSGSWIVYIDTVLAGTAALTHSEVIYNSLSIPWEARSITFTATATSHLIKFLPVDNDANGTFSMSDTAGALRMGIDAISLSSATGIREYNPMLISVYPNPSNETFNISLPVKQTFNLQVTDNAGRTVYTSQNATGNITVDCSNYSSGVYFVKAVNERTVLTNKLVKQ
ncbi:MAG: T9SS type A sorting domain-containing protein [Bacteroidota bacterium]